MRCFKPFNIYTTYFSYMSNCVVWYIQNKIKLQRQYWAHILADFNENDSSGSSDFLKNHGRTIFICSYFI